MSQAVDPTVTPNQEDAVRALGSLPDLADHEVGGVLLVLDDKTDEHRIAQLQPTTDATPALRSVGESALRYYRDCEIIDFDSAATCVGNQIMWAPLSLVPLLRSVVHESSDLANIDPFDPKKDKLSRAKLTAIRIEADSGPVVFVQSVIGNQVVASSKKFGVLIKRGVIDVPKDDILLLNQGVTAIAAGEFVYFSNRLAFQKLFDLLQELRDRAEETFRDVCGSLKIKGFDEMLAAVTQQTQMLGKMASIQSKIDKYPKYKEAITMPRLLEFVRSHPECNVEVSGPGDDAELVFQSDVQHRFKILKVLDDDYLRSELTTLGYESNSKGQPISG